jgi:hypothetical protein
VCQHKCQHQSVINRILQLHSPLISALYVVFSLSLFTGEIYASINMLCYNFTNLHAFLRINTETCPSNVWLSRRIQGSIFLGNAFSNNEGFFVFIKYIGYNESCLKSSFRKFYGRYNDLVCNYKLSLAHMLNDLFHTLC